MASIKTRVAGLEQASKLAYRRRLTDVELALRLMRLEPGTPMYQRAWAIINRHTVRTLETQTNAPRNL